VWEPRGGEACTALAGEFVLERFRRDVAERGVQAPAVVPGFDPREDGALELAARGPGSRRVSFFLRVAKNASQTALSSAQPVAPIERSMPAARAV
jgi:hypothetical protein